MGAFTLIMLSMLAFSCAFGWTGSTPFAPLFRLLAPVYAVLVPIAALLDWYCGRAIETAARRASAGGPSA